MDLDELDQRLLTLLLRKGLRAVYYAGVEDGTDKANRPTWKQRLDELKKLEREELMEISIEELDFPDWLHNALRRQRIYTIGDLCNRHADQAHSGQGLRGLPGIGDRAFKLIKHTLEELRIEIKDLRS